MTIRSISPADAVKLLVSPAGSIGRCQFATGALMLAIVAIATNGMVVAFTDNVGVVSFLFAVTVAWSAGCLSRKRLHDLGWSGVVIAVFLASYIALVLACSIIRPYHPAWFIDVTSLAEALTAVPPVAWLAWLVFTPGETARESRRAAIHAALEL
jgi:uncharacterized membrane protein YhaH (DUF805 family)